MDLRQLTPDLAVSPQISTADVPALAAAGFRVLVNNRPDAEVGPTEAHAAMQAAAAAAGMRYHYLPFTPGQITPDLLSGFEAATASGGPVIAYCRSGNRCTILWALTQAGRRDEAEIMAIATRAGYDISGIRPMIAELARG